MSNSVHTDMHQAALFKCCMFLANIKNWTVKIIELFFIINIQKYSHTRQVYRKLVVC